MASGWHDYALAAYKELMRYCLTKEGREALNITCKQTGVSIEDAISRMACDQADSMVAMIDKLDKEDKAS